MRRLWNITQPSTAVCVQLLVFCLTKVAWGSICDNPDGELLLPLGNANPQLGWNCDLPVCSDWKGVECDELGEIVKLDVDNMDVQGTLPPEWSTGFASLKLMRLGNYSLTGSLPPQWKDGFPRLEEMSLAVAMLNGTLPPEWKDGFPELIIMELHNNTLSGSLPTEWSEGFKKLKVMQMNNNILTGDLPIGWKDGFEALEELDLDTLQLNGTLPSEWHEGFRNLRNLSIVETGLTGTLPTDWYKGFPSLERINLRGTKLSGSLPPEWHKGFKNLTFLAVQGVNDYKLNGTLPKEWAKGFPKLQKLFLSSNEISGSLPVEWKNGFQELNTLSVMNNKLSGPLPDEWVEGFPKLKFLKVRDNALSGTLPEIWVEGFPSIVELQLRQNKLTGTLPEVWGTGFGTLSQLRVASNLLTGTLPAAWAKGPGLQNITELVLETNRFSGTIPQEQWQAGFPNMEELYLHDNCLTGTIEGTFDIGQNALVTLDHNFLTGQPNQKSGDPAVCTGDAEPMSTSDSSSDVGLIVGLAVGITAAVVLAVCLVVFLMIRAHRKKALLHQKADERSLASLVSSLPVKSHYNAAPLSSLVEEISCTTNGGPGPDPTMQSADDISSAIRLTTARSSFPTVIVTSKSGENMESDGGKTVSMTDSGHHPSNDGGKSLGGASDVRAWLMNAEEVIMCRTMEGNYLSLGRGATSEVYKGTYHDRVVAVKVMEQSPEMSDFENLKRVVREINMLRHVDHPNVLKFYGAAFSERHIMLVFDFMPKGDLFTALHRNQLNSTNGKGCTPEYTWKQRGRSIAICVAEALEYLHGKRIVHCDIKGQNILLDENNTPKIADLGMSKFAATDFVTKGGDFGTFAYAAPELLTDSRISNKVDIYSLGVVLWELVTGELPMKDNRQAMRVPEECSQHVADVISTCLSLRPDDRPTAAELCRLLKAV